jgi:hypothetical protein
VIVAVRGKGSKRCEIPILAQRLRLHIGTRRAAPLFQSRERGAGTLAVMMPPLATNLLSKDRGRQARHIC